jgi:lysophospholipase L1-like esterase
MRTTFFILFGLLVGLIGGIVAWVLGGLIPGILVAAIALALAVWAARREPGAAGGAIAALVILLLAALGVAAWQGAALARALGDTSGPVAPADPQELASASEKLDEADASAGFRIELDEGELTALVQEALVEAKTPLSVIKFDVDDQDQVLDFDGSFRSGDLDIIGSARVTAQGGGIDVELLEVNIGAMTLPGVIADAVQDIVAGVADFSAALAKEGASIQAVDYTPTSLVLTGTSRDGAVLTSDILLGNLREQAGQLAGVVDPPTERIGPGRVNGVAEGGPPYVVALGDSLAANVGVTEARDGYVSRFHAEVERRDRATYGLRNFGISGETSGSLLHGGQLEQAVQFMENNDIAYVTIDIGANDLLGHLGSPDCEDDLTSGTCRDRIEDTFITYEETLSVILDEIVAAAGDATIVFMQTYNPFSLGFGGLAAFEDESDATVTELNQVAASVAVARGILVADAFTPMRGTASVTTHMTENPPDIHPRAIGFDILAVALVDTLD